ncbi:MAG: MFS transporter [Oscillospiraceae bacterium]|nr:MFS transporter [Oscillospiraceae bacterium]
MKKLKPITNKVLWTFAVGQFGWSLLSGIISTWLVHLYTGNAEKFLDTNGILSQFISQNPLIASLTLFGIITAVGRLFDAVTDPLIASWSDRSDYRGGRRIPFLKAASIPFALITAAVFFVPSTGSVAANNTLMFVLLMLFYLIMTIYCTPYNALIAELGDTQKNRINVSTFISFTYIAGFSLSTMVPSLANVFQGGKISAILAPIAQSKGVSMDELMVMLQGTSDAPVKMDAARELLGGDVMNQVLLAQQSGMRIAIAVMCAVACLACLVPAFFIKEREYIDSKPSKTPAFSSLFKTFKNAQFRRFVYADVIYFFAVTLFQTGLADFETRLMGIPSDNTFTLTVIMTVVSLALYLPVNKLAPKLGKKKIIITGFFAYACVFLITALCPQDGGFPWGLIIAISAGIPMAILGILPQACVADVSELSTLETGEDRSGMFFAARTFAMKLGQALSMVVYTSVTAAAILESGEKYVAPAQYRTVTWVAVVTCLIGAILFLFYDEKGVLGRIDELKKKRA